MVIMKFKIIRKTDIYICQNKNNAMHYVNHSNIMHYVKIVKNFLYLDKQNIDFLIER